MRARNLAILLALFLANAGLLAAHETTGTIQGRLSDPQGLAVPGATVTVTGPQGTKTTTSDANGRFSIPFLTPGVYAVRSELQGFKAAEQKDILVRLGQTVDLPLKMQVGGRRHFQHARPQGRHFTRRGHIPYRCAVLDIELIAPLHQSSA